MVCNILVPKSLIEMNDPLIFLAGPINGAPNWHDEAIEYFQRNVSGIYLASPNSRLEKRFWDSVLTSENKTESRLEWERFYLDYASRNGCIMFWLPNQLMPNCNRAYGRDTRGELGEWRGVSRFSKPRLVIGGEENFDGYDVIKRNFLVVNPGMKFYSTLEDTCNAAIVEALSSR